MIKAGGAARGQQQSFPWVGENKRREENFGRDLFPTFLSFFPGLFREIDPLFPGASGNGIKGNSERDTSYSILPLGNNFRLFLLFPLSPPHGTFEITDDSSPQEKAITFKDV
ncbi:hypothetical protein TNIN_355211 [Trichonephila inaurata madagascariensis]|uniref:Uncharacterized protein n=1 Tax=Trichonephila inaurata madagascariensis TaxID=2747483 RepID=A0A8X6XHR0_9ARAC|nr:hypothetical protein TNIN_355211 [Trichonephila inaurata madagascariensis]